MFKNLIITIFTILITASYTLANPIPVFCLAGWIDACKGYSSAMEHDNSKGGISKRYSLLGPSVVVESDNYNSSNNKTYSISGSTIYGNDGYYSISGSTIYSNDGYYSISGSTIYGNGKYYSLH